MPDLRPDSEQTRSLLARIDRGEENAIGLLLRHYRPAIREFVESRIDRRISARIDPSDVVQEAQITVARRIHDYLKRRPMPFHIWTRKVAYERLLNARAAHRRECRSVEREVALPDRSSIMLARPLLIGSPSPSRDAEHKEQCEQLYRAVAQLTEGEREVLLMRHVENLPYDEIACLLDIEPATARKRYGRALTHLQKSLAKFGLAE